MTIRISRLLGGLFRCSLVDFLIFLGFYLGFVCLVVCHDSNSLTAVRQRMLVEYLVGCLGCCNLIVDFVACRAPCTIGFA